MRVVDRRRWHRTKCGFGLILMIVAVISGGGFEDETGVTPMPSFVIWVTAMLSLLWLAIHLAKESERL